jgi:hypothetical protein
MKKIFLLFLLLNFRSTLHGMGDAGTGTISLLNNGDDIKIQLLDTHGKSLSDRITLINGTSASIQVPVGSYLVCITSGDNMKMKVEEANVTAQKPLKGVIPSADQWFIESPKYKFTRS